MIVIEQYLRVCRRERVSLPRNVSHNLLQAGPMVSGITPQEASDRLNTFQVIIYL